MSEAGRTPAMFPGRLAELPLHCAREGLARASSPGPLGHHLWWVQKGPLAKTGFRLSEVSSGQLPETTVSPYTCQGPAAR